ncbi:hypothetical protein DDB_G0283089 [Dictyostelium discoideum AX4]|uniref:FNIP repeat-containing protein n=1 Tax=Dictyostelium discoideum TaxID=44689 RepID=Q54RL2_DICDI|nr:hypothetical protein DDB_G0283089 [Dictyostelium discoideum AX4]EAL65874.1 hypothetical protein DDB_G0283089 [Dictyostelium discoideum AX4]|eukprot:XP_639224.1 hypothetical protein DDB_G0283089 [Dictyostelium discoideum AX4]
MENSHKEDKGEKEEEEKEKEEQKQNSLFYKVWGNIVIFKNIFRFVRLYEKNEMVVFKSRKELLEYPEREFIHCLLYSSNELLEVGDLPIGCVLKEVDLTNYIHANIHGSKIPFGVEKLDFSWIVANKFSFSKTQISTFPSSLKTINQIILGKDESLKNSLKSEKCVEKENENEKEKKEEDEFENSCFIIPSNINTVFLKVSPNISGVDKGRGYVVLLKGLKEISFGFDWENENLCLRKGDLPDGIEVLKMPRFQLKNIISKDILPNSIKDLSISYGARSKFKSGDNDDLNNDPGKFDVLPPAIEKLYIYNNYSIKKDSLLNTLTSIKELRIINHELKPLLYEASSLPPNITTLSLKESFKSKIEIGVIPFGVKHLEFTFLGSFSNSNPIEIGAIPSSVESLSIDGFITQPEILPPSLTHLTYTQFYIRNLHRLDHIVSYFSLLPKSINLLTLDISFKDLNLTFPPSINKIEFKEKYS